MSTRKRKVIRSEGREIIAKVYHFMKSEAENGVHRLTDARGRTAEATGVSEQTVTRILREEKELPTTSKFANPMKKRTKRKSKIDVDSFEIDIIRRSIQSFHLEFNKLPSLKQLKQVLEENIKFDGSISTLRRLLFKLGYRWRKTSTNSKMLTEKHDIQMLRLMYLTALKQYRSEGRPLVYTGMTWGNKDSSPFMKKLSKGNRFILVHAGTKDGFIPNAFLMYKADSIAGDYQLSMDHEDYLKWLNEKLLPNLPENSVIIMDNPTYHNVRAIKIPTSNTNKAELEKWLVDNNIDFDENMKNVELYDLIKKNREKIIESKIDEVIHRKGHIILKLPPYHPELNAIEKVWEVLKSHVAEKDIEQKINSIIQLVEEQVNMIDNTMWAMYCRLVEEIETEYMKYLDTDFKMVINLQSDSESTDISDCDTSDE